MKPSLLLISGLLILSGCASMANTDHTSVTIYTEPPNATLLINGRQYQSPDIVKLPRGQGDFKLTVEKPSYQRQEILLIEAVDQWTYFNVLNLGLGLFKDFASKRAYTIKPEILRVTLTPEP